MSRDQHPELPVDPDPAQVGRRRARTGPAHTRPLLLLAVAVGGLLGTPARYATSLLLPTPVDGWPASTFLVNLVGAFLLGLLLEALARGGADVGWRRGVRLLAGTGFCGSFTTYSSLAVEVDLLSGHARMSLAIGYGLASMVAGLLATAAGIVLAVGHHRVRTRRTPAGTESRTAADLR